MAGIECGKGVASFSVITLSDSEYGVYIYVYIYICLEGRVLFLLQLLMHILKLM